MVTDSQEKETMDKMGKTKMMELIESMPECLMVNYAIDMKTFDELVKAQYTIGREYFHETCTQARNSFRWAMGVATLGFVGLLLAIWFMMVMRPQDLSALSIIGSVVIQATAGVIFYVHTRAANRSESAHIRSERTLLFFVANSILNDLEGETRQQARAELVRTMMNFPATRTNESQKEYIKLR